MLFTLTAMNRNMDVVEHLKFEEFLKNSAVFITLITALFYSCSSLYIHGYFYVLGLDSDVLERNFHSIVFHGFTLSLNKSVFIFYILVLIFWLRAIFASEMSKLLKIRKSAKKLITYKKRLFKFFNLNSKTSSWPALPYLIPAVRILMFFVLFVFVVVTLNSFKSDGQAHANYVKSHIVDEIAEKPKSMVTADRVHPFKMVTSLKSDLNRPLHLLYCGSHMCAGFDVESEEVVYFPQSGYRLKSGLVSIP